VRGWIVDVSLEHMVKVRKQIRPGSGLGEVDPIDKYVLMLLAWHANHDDETWPSFKTLARDTGFHRETISKAVDRLVSGGHLILVAKQWEGRSNKYRIPVEFPSFPEPTAEKTKYASRTWTDPALGGVGHVDTSSELALSTGVDQTDTSGVDQTDTSCRPDRQHVSTQDRQHVSTQDRHELTRIQKYSGADPLDVVENPTVDPTNPRYLSEHTKSLGKQRAAEIAASLRAGRTDAPKGSGG
jgi:hypothetical protein